MKSTKILLGLIVLSILLTLGIQLYVRHTATDRHVAKILAEGEVVMEIDLSQVTAPYSFTLEWSDGHYSTFGVEPGRICILDANCPDRLCVRQGWMSDGTVPITCLPFRVVIELTKGGGLVDAATG